MVTSVLPGPGVSTALPRPLSSCAPLGRIEHMFDSDGPQDVGGSPMSDRHAEVVDRRAAPAGPVGRRRRARQPAARAGAAEGRRSGGAGRGDGGLRSLAARRAAGGRCRGRPGGSGHRRPGCAGSPRVAAPARSRLVGLAQALTAELPATLAALRAGETSEWRATIIARETACLGPGRPARCRRRARSPTGQARRPRGRRAGPIHRLPAATRTPSWRAARGAARDRRVSLRPAPDTMSRLTGFLPVAQGVAAYAALSREADRLTAEGDRRGRGQIMADTMVERLTGQASASATPVEVHLVMPEETLLRGADEPRPSRRAAARCRPRSLASWCATERRASGCGGCTRDQRDGALVAMESGRRAFPAALRRVLVVRDQVCRTPWCGAPIRHADHVVGPLRGRPHQRGQRAGTVRGLQLRQAGARLAGATEPARSRRPRRPDHSDRAPLCQPAATAAREPAAPREQPAGDRRSAACSRPPDRRCSRRAGQDSAAGADVVATAGST